MNEASNNPAFYVGRFAPSPTGPLHFGSLVAALASYLDARHYHGKWLVRIEDLDPPREQVGAIDDILRCLEAHHLHWDGEILYQSHRLEAYVEIFEQLKNRQLIYPCTCTRKALAEIGGLYPGTCRTKTFVDIEQPVAWRLLTDYVVTKSQNDDEHYQQFDDLFLGVTTCKNTLGDFIVKRKDGLFAYQLAVVVDDIYQKITHVIRGNDLLDSTPAQLILFHHLNTPPPQYGHIALALNSQGQKLSKQHGAPAVNNADCKNNIIAALKFLNHMPTDELLNADINAILDWAANHWHRAKLPKENRIVEN